MGYKILILREAITSSILDEWTSICMLENLGVSPHTQKLSKWETHCLKKEKSLLSNVYYCLCLFVFLISYLLVPHIQIQFCTFQSVLTPGYCPLQFFWQRFSEGGLNYPRCPSIFTLQAIISGSGVISSVLPVFLTEEKDFIYEMIKLQMSLGISFFSAHSNFSGDISIPKHYRVFSNRTLPKINGLSLKKPVFRFIIA